MKVLCGALAGIAGLIWAGSASAITTDVYINGGKPEPGTVIIVKISTQGGGSTTRQTQVPSSGTVDLGKVPPNAGLIFYRKTSNGINWTQTTTEELERTHTTNLSLCSCTGLTMRMCSEMISYLTHLTPSSDQSSTDIKLQLLRVPMSRGSGEKS